MISNDVQKRLSNYLDQIERGVELRIEAIQEIAKFILEPHIGRDNLPREMQLRIDSNRIRLKEICTALDVQVAHSPVQVERAAKRFEEGDESGFREIIAGFGKEIRYYFIATGNLKGLNFIRLFYKYSLGWVEFFNLIIAMQGSIAEIKEYVSEKQREELYKYPATLVENWASIDFIRMGTEIRKTRPEYSYDPLVGLEKIFDLCPDHKKGELKGLSKRAVQQALKQRNRTLIPRLVELCSDRVKGELFNLKYLFKEFSAEDIVLLVKVCPDKCMKNWFSNSQALFFPQLLEIVPKDFRTKLLRTIPESVSKVSLLYNSLPKHLDAFHILCHYFNGDEVEEDLIPFANLTVLLRSQKLWDVGLLYRAVLSDNAELLQSVLDSIPDDYLFTPKDLTQIIVYAEGNLEKISLVLQFIPKMDVLFIRAVDCYCQVDFGYIKLLKVPYTWDVAGGIEIIVKLCPKELKGKLFDDENSKALYSLMNNFHSVLLDPLLKIYPEHLVEKFFSAEYIFSHSDTQFKINAIKHCPTYLKEAFFSKDKKGNTPVHLAAAKDYWAIQTLVEECPPHLKGALFDPNVDGDTPLHLCRGFDGAAIVNAIKQVLQFVPPEKREGLFAPNRLGRNPLHCAIAIGGRKPALEIYGQFPPTLKHLAFAPDSKGKNPVFLATCLSAQDFKLIYAAYPGSKEELFKMRDHRGNTLFHAAVNKNWEEGLFILWLYSEAPACLQGHFFEPNADGDTPLHLAAACGDRPNAQLVLRMAPDQKRLLGVNSAGKTPLDLCLECGRGTGTLLFTLSDFYTNDVLKASILAHDKNKVAAVFYLATPEQASRILALDIPSLDCAIADALIARDTGFPWREQIIQRMQQRPESYTQEIFATTHLVAYLLKRYSGYVQEQLERIGGIEKLSFDQALLVLPLLAPSKIVELLAQLGSVPKDLVAAQETLSEDREDRLPHLEVENVETVFLGEIKKHLAKISLPTLGVIARNNASLIFPFVPHLDDSQLAVVIPFLEVPRCGELIQQTSSTIKQSYYIRRMTLTQKKAVVRALSMLPATIPNKEAEYSTFSQQYSTFQIQAQEIVRLERAFTQTESDRDLAETVAQKMGALDVIVSELKAALDSMTSDEEEIPEEFADALMGGLMERPIHIVRNRVYVDEATYLRFPTRNNRTERFNPFAQDYFPEAEFVRNPELEARIAAWKESNSFSK